MKPREEAFAKELQSTKQFAAKKGNDDVLIKLVSVLSFSFLLFIAVYDMYFTTILLVCITYFQGSDNDAGKKKENTDREG